MRLHFILFLFLPFLVHGQLGQNDLNLVTITLIDNTTLDPVAEANVISQKGRTTVTNLKGQAKILFTGEHDSITITHTSYSPKYITFHDLKAAKYVLFLSPRTLLLDEITLSATKDPEKMSEMPFKVELIDSKSIEFGNPQNSADMLQNSGGVFVQKSQMGGGSPVLRGFEANKVLLVVDGVRMNNAIYRGGHLQDVLSIDQMIIERTEVLMGPSSVMYGSDALGGVMHFYTKRPDFGADSTVFSGATLFRWSSVNDEFTGHVHFSVGGKKVASLTSISFSEFSDLRSGNIRDAVYDQSFTTDHYVIRIDNKDSMVDNPDRNIQRFSGYRQNSYLQKFVFQGPKKRSFHTLNFQYALTSDIPRYDRLSEYSGPTKKFAEWFYGPQERLLASYNINADSVIKIADSFRSTFSYQFVSQERNSRRFNNPDLKTQLENVHIAAVNFDLAKRMKDKHHFHYGFEGTYNLVSSTAKFTDIVTGIERNADTRYPDGGSSMLSGAIYMQHTLYLRKNVFVIDGFRYNYVTLKSKFIDTTFFPFPFKEITVPNHAATGNLGLVLLPGKTWKFSLLASSGYRVPNVDDIGKVFDSQPGTLIIPNPKLEPEEAYNGEIGIEKTFMENIRITTNVWYTYLLDAIVIVPYTFAGSDSIMYDGVNSKVYAARNTDHAYVTGISGTFKADLSEHFSLTSTATWTYGRYYSFLDDTLTPMDHIPPAFGQTSLVYRGRKTEAEVFVRYNGWKELKDYSLSGEDNLQYATLYGMPSWTTVNLRLGIQINKNFRALLALENVMDTHYRVFASGISAPGRNLVIALKGKF